MKKTLAVAAALVLSTFVGSACGQTALKDVYRGKFRVGVALSVFQIYGRDARGLDIATSQFDSITPENALKWEKVHPKPNVYDFGPPDKFVALGQKHKMFTVGHCLVWHSQTPKWVFEDSKGEPLTRAALLKRMREHIHTVVGRYKGRIGGWDVVNEALNEDGTLRQSAWMKIIGEDYIAKAFQYAHEADPKAELYYNDYSLENPAKRAGAVALLKKLKAQRVPVTAVGLQGHDRLDWPTIEEQDATIKAFGNLGLKVAITELDVDVLPAALKSNTADVSAKADVFPELNPYASGLPDNVEQALAKRYADLFGVFLKNSDVVKRVTFWGVTDADSWKNDWPVKGRTNYPLLFDRGGKPKSAFDAVAGIAQQVAAEQTATGGKHSAEANKRRQ